MRSYSNQLNTNPRWIYEILYLKTQQSSCFARFLKKSGYYIKIILIGQPIPHVPFVDKNTYLVSKRDDRLLLSRPSQDQPRLITAAAGPPLIRQQPGGLNKQECLHVIWKALWSAFMRVRERVCASAGISLCARGINYQINRVKISYESQANHWREGHRHLGRGLMMNSRSSLGVCDNSLVFMPGWSSFSSTLKCFYLSWKTTLQRVIRSTT